MKEILNSFRVRIDENCKEVENPELKGDNSKDRVFGYTEQLIKHSNATEVIKLPTLSEFVGENYKYKDRHYVLRSICEYNDFLQQPLTKEMFIGEDAIFVGWEELDYNRFIEHYANDLTIEQYLNGGGILYLNPDKI